MPVPYSFYSQIQEENLIWKNKSRRKRYYQKIEIVEGAVCADHVHLCLSIPPSEKVCDVVAYIKGKSALMIHDRYPETVNGWSKSFWARGYYVATVGNITEEAVKKYIQEQKEKSKREDTR